MLRLHIQCVKGYGQRVDIRIITVVDEGAIVDSLFQLKPHGNGRQRLHLTGSLFVKLTGL